MKLHVTAGLGFVLVLTALAGPSAAAARHGQPLRCGDAITTDTRLTANLMDCAEGVVIGADGITLDLNGHRIDGDASVDSVGIDVEGHRGVTIENGAVREFAEGVLVLGGSDITIRRVTSTDEGHGGILVDSGRHVTITGSVARRSGAGIIVTRSNRVRVVANRVSGSGFGGIPVFDSRHIVIAGNTVLRCRTDMGIGLVGGSSHSIVVGNRVSRNGAGIVAADRASHNLIAENIVRRNDSGVILDVGTHHNRVVGNVIDHSAFEGIAVVASDGNLIARNRVVHSGQVDPAGGIVIIPLPENASEASDANQVVHNLALENHGDGILVGELQTANLVRANRAYRNTQLGIDAAAGTIDGGRNRAAHNGDPRQCVGVACAYFKRLAPGRSVTTAQFSAATQ
jgi:parallel beta-helix repeat protein